MAELEGKSLPVEEAEGKEEEEDTSLANPDVTTKYQEAAKIVNSTLTEIIGLVVVSNISTYFTSASLGPMLLTFVELAIN